MRCVKCCLHRKTGICADCAGIYGTVWRGGFLGAIRAALERGFSGMVEVAVFADILTLKEALEFDRRA